MSITAKNKKIKKEARREYETKLVEMKTAEHNAMNEMLNILRNTDSLMTAAQVEAACTSDISKHEVASNLRAMKTGHSRYRYIGFFCGHRIPSVDIPRTNSYGVGEVIVTKGGRRKATIVEVDENNNIIPNTKREIMLNESLRYGIEKVR